MMSSGGSTTHAAFKKTQLDHVAFKKTQLDHVIDIILEAGGDPNHDIYCSTSSHFLS